MTSIFSATQRVCAAVLFSFFVFFIGFTLPVQAQGLKWQAFSGSSRASLIHGVPETDEQQFNATCSKGKSRISARLGYRFVKGLRNGRSVTFRYFSNRGSGRLSGVMAGIGNTQEQIGGVQLSLTRGHKMWTALRKANTVRYSVNKRGKVSMGLRGSSAAINKFLNACKRLAAGKKGKKPKPTSSNAIGCGVRNVKSRTGGRRQSVRFTNTTKWNRKVSRISGNGGVRPQRTLRVGKSYTFSARRGQVWMLANSRGKCRQMMRVNKSTRRFNITR